MGSKIRMANKDEILGHIRDLAAKNGGTAPGRRAFETSTGLGQDAWRGKYWSDWGDAVREAGLTANEKTTALDRDYVMSHYLLASRQRGRPATMPDLRIYAKSTVGAPGHNAFARQYAGLNGLRLVAKEFIKANDGWADLAELFADVLPEPEGTGQKSVAKEGWIYLLGDQRGSYKIERRDDVEGDGKPIAVAKQEKLNIEHLIRTDDPVGIEAYWHNRFADRRANGAWFKLTPDDIRAFKKRRFM